MCVCVWSVFPHCPLSSRADSRYATSAGGATVLVVVGVLVVVELFFLFFRLFLFFFFLLFFFFFFFLSFFLLLLLLFGFLSGAAVLLTDASSVEDPTATARSVLTRVGLVAGGSGGVTSGTCGLRVAGETGDLRSTFSAASPKKLPGGS